MTVRYKTEQPYARVMSQSSSLLETLANTATASPQGRDLFGGGQAYEKEFNRDRFILDRSGSMNGLERDTIGGFNSMIEQQKKTEANALISTVLLINVSEVLHDRVDVKDIRTND